MSYQKAMTHFRNHRKDRFFQQCGGPRPDAFQKKNNPVPYVDALKVLDEMDEYRRDCILKGRTDTDFALRKACQIIASAAGFADRPSWQEAINTATTEELLPVEGKAVALVVLRDIEAWRKKHFDVSELYHCGIDYALRYAEAVVAKNAGFKNRRAWTDVLKQDFDTLYGRDHSDPSYPAWNLW